MSLKCVICADFLRTDGGTLSRFSPQNNTQWLPAQGIVEPAKNEASFYTKIRQLTKTLHHYSNVSYSQFRQKKSSGSKMSYQKFYSNQIHSSSLLCQLSHLWKSQLLCDALIRAGSITIKAHRLVLIAACPMLQSMENASAGSHLEVRLAADIKQDSVNTFLQYLYEGFMMLTEENVRDVEKVARLLQVDGVIKCCADFYKSLKVKTGVAIQPGHNYKYSFQDLVEFRHVRASDIIKSTQDRITKRASEFSRPGSPGGKRQRMYMHPGSPSVERADDHHSMSDSYKTSHMTPDPWERVPRLGSGMGRHGATGRSNSQPGVIEIVEDSLEIVQTEPVNKDPNKPSDTRQTVQKSVAISIASQITDNTDLRVVNITGSNRDGGNTSTTSSAKSSSHSQQDSFPPKSNVSSSPLTSLQQSFSSSAMHRMPDMPSHMMPGPSFRQERAPELFQIPNFSSSDLELVQVSKPSKPPDSSANTSSSQSQRQPFPVSLSPVGASSKPSFAIGSASQSPSSQTMGSPMAMPTSTPIQPAHTVRSQSQSSTGTSEGVERASPVVDSGKNPSSYKEKQEPSPSSTAEMTPDISIVKVEGQDKDDTGGLDMYVDMPPDGTMTMHSGTGEESDNDHDEALEEWAREESVNESGDMSQMDPGGAKDSSIAPFGRIYSQLQHGVAGQTGEITPSSEQHIPCRTPGNSLKRCVFCQLGQVKTKSGWSPLTRFQCAKCGVPLCLGQRSRKNCFLNYHRYISTLSMPRVMSDTNQTFSSLTSLALPETRTQHLTDSRMMPRSDLTTGSIHSQQAAGDIATVHQMSFQEIKGSAAQMQRDSPITKVSVDPAPVNPISVFMKYSPGNAVSQNVFPHPDLAEDATGPSPYMSHIFGDGENQ
ncbi:serine-rich adhesin for platelets-like isoform X2 [Argopecten irradians]|uniref:serine-rich adhesin for platelets-like isoform X2 n=1 Tax=Argopecten irradians TaxID=31199 RepID=UPI0037121166